MHFFLGALRVNLYPATIFGPENVSAFYISRSAAYVQVHFRLDFFMEANTMKK